MDDNTVCFLLFGVLFIGFLLLEGFDYGAGMLLPYLGRTDAERRAIIRTMAPVWEGNEVWLIAAGAFLFAGFPDAYATLFSGMYLALLLILAPLILRGVAFEFRDKDARAGWRNFWDWALFTGSLLPAVLWGVAVGNLLKGLPIDARLEYAGTFGDLLSPYALVSGLLFALLFLLHGAAYLTMKLDGEIVARTRRLGMALAGYVLLAALLFAVFTYVVAGLKFATGAALLLAVLAISAASCRLGDRHYFQSFIFSGMAVVAAGGAVFAGLYPRLVVSSLNPAWSLTIYNSASNPLTLEVMSITTAVVFPAILAFEGWKYYVFRQVISPAGLECEPPGAALANRSQELREQLRRARCLADVMSCVTRALRSHDGRVINRLKHRHKVLLLGKRTEKTEPGE